MAALLNLSWQKLLIIGLGTLAFGALLKTEELSGASPAKFALGQAAQFFSLLFLASALFSLIRIFFGRFFSKDMGLSPAPLPVLPPVPPSPAAAPAAPAPSPAPVKKQYTERDFMPPEMRTTLEEKEKTDNLEKEK